VQALSLFLTFVCTQPHTGVDSMERCFPARGGFMAGRTPQEITCQICNEPIVLERDKYTDEDGKTVHENCYVQRLLSAENDPPDPHHTERSAAAKQLY
jgi:hypothetical protein